MRQTIVRTLIVAFGLLFLAVVSRIIFVGYPDRYEEMDELAGRFESHPSPQHLRDLLNYPADASYSFYHMALVGASFARHPSAFQEVAGKFRTESEREILQELASRGAEVFEYYPELKPVDFEQRFEEQVWLKKIGREHAVGGNRR